MNLIAIHVVSYTYLQLIINHSNSILYIQYHIHYVLYPFMHALQIISLQIISNSSKTETTKPSKSNMSLKIKYRFRSYHQLVRSSQACAEPIIYRVLTRSWRG